jgi:DnaA family protein
MNAASAMTQLLLDLEPPPQPTFDNFVVGGNAEAVAVIRRLGAHDAGDPSKRFLYLWGEAGSGRSHLLRAACAARDGRYLDGPGATATAIEAAANEAHGLIAIDDVETIDAVAQEALFHAINRLRDDPRASLIVAGNATPRDLALQAERDDLRSRLAWGLVYRIERLDDAEKDAALARHASTRSFPLTPDVRRYLLTHFSRDLGSLMQMIDALDRHAREHQRVVTVPMIRDFLQLSLPSSEAA